MVRVFGLGFRGLVLGRDVVLTKEVWERRSHTK